MSERSVAPRTVPPGVLVALVGLLALTWWAYRPVLALGHLGWDTWPLLLTCRVVEAGDLAGAFREPLMDGLYPHGSFYRPVLSLSIALDHAVWGTLPLGYHLTDLLILVLGVGAVFGAGRRLLGDPWAALAAAALFALHPLHFESLPATARRGDALAGLFTLLALAGLPRGARRPGLAAGVFALLAVGAKETGAVAAPLLALLAFSEADGGARQRLRAALRTAAPALGLLVAFLVLRAGVLGGLGGHAETSLLAGLARAPFFAAIILPALAVPQPLGPGALLAGALLVLLLLGALLLLAARQPALRRPLALAGAWALLLLLLSGVSGDLAPWYAAALLPPWALIFGGLVAGLRADAPRLTRPLRTAGVALALLLVASPLRYAGLFERYEQWQRLSAASERFLEDLERRIEALPAEGGSLRVTGLPEREERSGPVGVHGAAGLGSYSVGAWAALALPARQVAVQPERGADGATELLLVVEAPGAS